MAAPQLDLFGDQPSAAPEFDPAAFNPTPEFIARIRGELEETLAAVRRATTFPWPDLTRTTLAELRVHAIARWLPPEEAAALRAAFEMEMARLYAAEDNGPAMK